MKVYIVMVTAEASLSHVSQEAYTSLSAAQEFILSRYGMPEKINDFKYRDADYTTYEIVEVSVL